MPIESRQGPIYFHAIQNDKYRSEHDRIFGKKDKVVVSKPKAKKKPKKTAGPSTDNT